jgi:ATP-dependent protease ClpP protease subunit
MSATGRRYIFSDTTVLIHSGSAGFYDNTDKVIDYSEFTKKQEERVKQYILKNTKITDKMYEKNYRKDLWLFSDEIIEYGIADKIITDLEEIF